MRVVTVRLDPRAVPERTTVSEIFKVPGAGIDRFKNSMCLHCGPEMWVHIVYVHPSGPDEIEVGFSNPWGVPIIPHIGNYELGVII